jgi:hypothetical protein
MKKLAAILCLSAVTTGAFAQGLVTFANSGSTLTTATINNQTAATAGAVGSWYYGLLVAPAGTVDPKAFTFANVYATNLSTAGRLFGGVGVAATGWAAGANMSYEIAVWSSSLGHNWNAGWLTAGPNDAIWGAGGNFGLSGIATGISGGAGSPASPPYNLFGGATGIASGFNAAAVGGVPEPSSMALAGLGAAALLIFRRRK